MSDTKLVLYICTVYILICLSCSLEPLLMIIIFFFPLSISRWNLVEIDADLPQLTFETKHVMALIDPAKTYMVFFFNLVVF